MRRGRLSDRLQEIKNQVNGGGDIDPCPRALAGTCQAWRNPALIRLTFPDQPRKKGNPAPREKAAAFPAAREGAHHHMPAPRYQRNFPPHSARARLVLWPTAKPPTTACSVTGRKTSATASATVRIARLR